jgi:hypothetical protein
LSREVKDWKPLTPGGGKMLGVLLAAPPMALDASDVSSSESGSNAGDGGGRTSDDVGVSESVVVLKAGAYIRSHLI